MARRETYLTPDGLKQLQEELGHLKNVRRSEVAERIHEAGGAIDNAEYDEAKNEQSFVEGRIRELENVLANAVVAPKRRNQKDSVGIGSSVTVENARGAKQKYQVVGTAEAAPLEGKISNESPIGHALFGRKVGDEVEVNAPSGVVKLTITRIR